MSGGSSTGQGGQNPLSAGIGGAAASSAQTPQWLKGLQLGTQMAQMGQRPMQPQMPMQHPMMGGGQPPGMVGGAVPGGQPQMPQSQGMMSGGTGMPRGGPTNGGQQGGINPQLLQMLMRSR